MSVDWDEFEERGRKRRTRRYPPPFDWGSLIIALLIVALAVAWLVKAL
jgi:hypothetical protein